MLETQEMGPLNFFLRTFRILIIDPVNIKRVGSVLYSFAIFYKET